MSKQLDLEQQVINLAQKDDKFRKALLKDAKAAVEERFGIKAPKALKIIVLEDTADTIHLVLPPKLDDKEGAVAWT
ncbi:MAG: NHLP leader peptide family RiPP precursor [Spirochaetales bacterium]|nr:NHLP leader peptide family RiPP precursor [Spirochaetales bacterium]